MGVVQVEKWDHVGVDEDDLRWRSSEVDYGQMYGRDKEEVSDSRSVSMVKRTSSVATTIIKW